MRLPRLRRKWTRRMLDLKRFLRCPRTQARTKSRDRRVGLLRKATLQPHDPQPEDRRRRALAALPLVDHGLASGADLVGQLLLTEAEPVPQANQRRRVVRRH